MPALDRCRLCRAPGKGPSGGSKMQWPLSGQTRRRPQARSRQVVSPSGDPVRQHRHAAQRSLLTDLDQTGIKKDGIHFLVEVLQKGGRFIGSRWRDGETGIASDLLERFVIESILERFFKYGCGIGIDVSGYNQRTDSARYERIS